MKKEILKFVQFILRRAKSCKKRKVKKYIVLKQNHVKIKVKTELDVTNTFFSKIGKVAIAIKTEYMQNLK